MKFRFYSLPMIVASLLVSAAFAQGTNPSPTAKPALVETQKSDMKSKETPVSTAAKPADAKVAQTSKKVVRKHAKAKVDAQAKTAATSTTSSATTSK
jgi:hypothetical protein